MNTMNKFGDHTDMAKAHAHIQKEDQNGDMMLELWEVTTPKPSTHPPTHPPTYPPSGTPYDEEMKALYYSIKDYKAPSTGPDQHYKDAVSKLFPYFDENQNGKIEAHEMMNTLNKFGEVPPVTIAEAYAKISSFDKNGDKMLELWEL